LQARQHEDVIPTRTLQKKDRYQPMDNAPRRRGNKMEPAWPPWDGFQSYLVSSHDERGEGEYELSPFKDDSEAEQLANHTQGKRGEDGWSHGKRETIFYQNRKWEGRGENQEEQEGRKFDTRREFTDLTECTGRRAYRFGKRGGGGEQRMKKKHRLQKTSPKETALAAQTNGGRRKARRATRPY